RHGAAIGDNHVDFLLHELRRDRGERLRSSFRPAIFNADVAALNPAEFAQPVHKRLGPWLPYRSVIAEDGDQRELTRLLRARRARRCGRSGAEQRDELALVHSITSSARASSVGGTSRPSAFGETEGARTH